MASSGYELKFVVQAEEAAVSLIRVSVGLREYLAMLVHQSAEETARAERVNAPVGIAGEAGQGLSHNIDADYDRGGLSASVGPNKNVSSYAAAVEFGSRPHMPPAFKGSALEQWAEMHGMNVWALAMSIAKNGTRPHPYVEPTYVAMQQRIPMLFENGVNQFIARAAG